MCLHGSGLRGQWGICFPDWLCKLHVARLTLGVKPQGSISGDELKESFTTSLKLPLVPDILSESDG